MVENAKEVVVPNHPHAREYNKYGCPFDIKHHDWVTCNIKFHATPEVYAPIKQAFSTTNPWDALGYKPSVECSTVTISRWAYRDCPVPEHDGHSLWLHFESKAVPPEQFLQFVANKFDMKVSLNYCPPYQVKWVSKTFNKE